MKHFLFNIFNLVYVLSTARSQDPLDRISNGGLQNIKSARAVRNIHGAAYGPYSHFPVNYGHPLRRPPYSGHHGAPAIHAGYTHGSYGVFRPIAPPYSNPSGPVGSAHNLLPVKDHRPAHSTAVKYSQPDPGIHSNPSALMFHRPAVYASPVKGPRPPHWSERDPVVYNRPDPSIVHETGDDLFPTLFYPPKPGRIQSYFDEKPKPGFVFPKD